MTPAQRRYRRTTRAFQRALVRAPKGRKQAVRAEQRKWLHDALRQHVEGRAG